MGREMSALIWVLQIQGWSVIHKHKKAGVCSRWGLQWVIIPTYKDVDKIGIMLGFQQRRDHVSSHHQLLLKTL